MDISKSSSPRKSLSLMRSQPTATQYGSMTTDKLARELNRLLTHSETGVKTIREILSANKGSTDVIKEVYLFCIEQLNKDLFTVSDSKELVGILLAEVNSLEGSTLVTITEFYIKLIKEGRVTNGVSLELFPLILEVVGRRQMVTCDNGERMDGMLCKGHLINTLFGSRWSPKCVVHVVNMCRDIQLLPEELNFLIEKLLRVMRTLPFDELPPLVHQLLVLPCKDHVDLVLEGILNLFDQFNKLDQQEQESEELMEVCSDKEALYRIEGTVLVHMSLAMTQNKNLRAQFLKKLKASQSQTDINPLYLSPFAIAIALSITKITSLSETIFDSLKSVVIKLLKHNEERHASSWLREFSQDVHVPAIEDLFVSLVEQSAYGWDPVLQGLFSFGFDLLDTYSSKLSPVCSLKLPALKACAVGGAILVKCFEHHALIRTELLNQLVNRVLANAINSCVTPYISIIAEVLRSMPQSALNTVIQLKDCLGYLNAIPSEAAIKLIQAVLPLVQYRVAVRDSLLIVLRKLLFSKLVECRLTAVGGYLLLLKHFKVLDYHGNSESGQSTPGYSYNSQSQTLAEVHSHHSGSLPPNNALCLEILGILRRCFSQQDVVKMALYEGLYDVVCINGKLVVPVLEMLLNQFDKYYEKDTDLTPPIHLDTCSASSNDQSGCGHTRREPLAHLLCCIQRCVRQVAMGDEGAWPVVGRAKVMLMSLANRMIKTELSDFELDRSSDYTTTPVGLKNIINAKLVMNINETLMDYVFASNSYQFSQESCDLVMKLFAAYSTVHNLLAEKNVGGAGRRGQTTAAGKFPCLLPMASTVLVLKAIFKNTVPAHQLGLKKCRESVCFVKYVCSTVHIKIHQIETQAYPWGWGSKTLSSRSQSNFENGCIIGSVLLEQLLNRDCSTKKEKGKSVQLLCLDGFHQLCHVICDRYPSNQIDQFIAQLVQSDTTAGAQNTLQLIQQFQGLLAAILAGSHPCYHTRDCLCVMNIIKILTGLLDPQSPQIKQVYEWALSHCKELTIDDSNIVKNLTSFTLSLSYSIQPSLKLVRRFAQDVHHHIGDIDEDIELSGETNYAIVNSVTASVGVFVPLMECIDRYLGDGTIIVKTTSIGPDDDSSQEVNLINEELTRIVFALSDLTQTSYPPGGNHNDTLIKSLIKLYGLLTDIAKYQLNLYTTYSAILPEFRKLMNNVGQLLSQQVYNYIMYNQETQAVLSEQTGGKGRGKKGKAPPTSGKNQVKKEARTIPKLIYGMEQLETVLLKISKKSKESLLDSFKRSVARDFRIKDRELDALLNEQDASASEEEDEDKGGTPPASTAGRPPAKKRAKK